jgi:hypothetical protein
MTSAYRRYCRHGRHGRHGRQRGAIAIVLALTLLVLLAMGGFVLDLGHLYIVKAELQNGADGAALAGAMELNDSAAGIDNASSLAQRIALKNNYDFSTPLALAPDQVTFSASADGPWSSVADARSRPQGFSFVRVDTGNKPFATYLMRVAGITSLSTAAVAVAGRFVNDVTPIGVCAVDPAAKTARYTYPAPPAGTGLSELVEFGFRRGVSYNLFDLNPLPGGPSDPYLINPVDAPPSACKAAHSSASSTAPFMCTGNSAVISSGVGQVYTNTGLTASLAASLNSRFDDYSGPSVCDPLTAPPDSNIKEYPCKGSADACLDNAANSIALTPPINWMEPGASAYPNRQTVAIDAAHKPDYRLPAAGATPAPNASYAQFADYGALWSYGPAYQASAGTPPKAGAAFTPQQANQNPLYSSSAGNYFDTTTPGNYPATAGAAFPGGTPASPYNQTSGPYFQAPAVAHPGQRNRRIINLVLIDCRVAPVGPPSCALMNTVGIGKFFMTVKADFSGARRLDAEFAGLIAPVPNADIKLYR